jgi:ATP-dependent RNA helicase DeaD
MISENITHAYFQCPIEDRLKVVQSVLQKEIFSKQSQKLLAEAVNQHYESQYIIFIDHKEKAQRYRRLLEASLRKKLLKLFPENESVLTFHIDNMFRELTDLMDINKRRLLMKAFRDGNHKILLCSDVAARGIDLPSTNMVIHMSIPNSADDYLHRSGRTGRLGRPGRVVVITQPNEEFLIRRYSNALGIEIKKRVINAPKKKQPKLFANKILQERKDR